MSDSQVMLAALVLEQKYRGRMVNCINRASTLLRTLPSKVAVSTLPVWSAKGSGQLAEEYAEGADAINFGSDSQAKAILTWGKVRSNFHLSGTSRRAAALAATPEGQDNQVIENIQDSTMALASLINQKLYTGSGATDKVCGLATAIADDNTYATIDRTIGGNEYWQSYVVDPGSSTDLSFAQIRADQAGVRKKGGEGPDLAVCDPDTWNTVASLFDGNRQYTQNVITTARGTITLDAGSEAIYFNGTAFVQDKDAPAKQILYLNTNWVHVEYLPVPADDMAQLAGMGIMVQANDGFGPIPLGFLVEKLDKSGDSDKFSMTFNGQLVVRKPSACGVRKNIAMAA